MGHRAIYTCNKCKTSFESCEGGGMTFIEYRCINCDNIKSIKSDRRVPPAQYKGPSEEEIGTCDKCGGELKDDLKPMCPKCKSRHVVVKKMLVMYD